MEVAVWDTFVTRKNGSIMHFDIIAPSEIKDSAIIHGFGLKYLKEKGEENQPLTSKECTFCHHERVKPLWEHSLKTKGYYIVELENCK